MRVSVRFRQVDRWGKGVVRWVLKDDYFLNRDLSPIQHTRKLINHATLRTDFKKACMQGLANCKLHNGESPECGEQYTLHRKINSGEDLVD